MLVEVQDMERPEKNPQKKNLAAFTSQIDRSDWSKQTDSMSDLASAFERELDFYFENHPRIPHEIASAFDQKWNGLCWQ